MFLQVIEAQEELGTCECPSVCPSAGRSGVRGFGNIGCLGVLGGPDVFAAERANGNHPATSSWVRASERCPGATLTPTSDSRLSTSKKGGYRRGKLALDIRVHYWGTDCSGLPWTPEVWAPVCDGLCALTVTSLFSSLRWEDTTAALSHLIEVQGKSLCFLTVRIHVAHTGAETAVGQPVLLRKMVA